MDRIKASQITHSAKAMTFNKKLIMALLAWLIAAAIKQRALVWEWIKPWPAWWKILVASAVAVFITFAFVFAAGLLPELLFIFDIDFPQ